MTDVGIPLDRIRGSVAAIVNDRELILNRGSAHGVRPGMVFVVLHPAGSQVVDPETGLELGSFPRPKVVVRVTDVKVNMAAAQTFRTRRVNVGGTNFSAYIDRLFTPPRYKYEYETLRKGASSPSPLSEHDSFVRIGDPVQQVLEHEDSDVVTGTSEVSTGSEPTDSPIDSP